MNALLYAYMTNLPAELVLSLRFTNVICQTKTDTNISILCRNSHPNLYMSAKFQLIFPSSCVVNCFLLLVSVSLPPHYYYHLFTPMFTIYYSLLVSFTITSNEFPALPTPYLTLISHLSKWIRFTASHIQYHFCYWLVQQYACLPDYCAIFLQNLYTSNSIKLKISKCLVHKDEMTKDWII